MAAIGADTGTTPAEPHPAESPDNETHYVHPAVSTTLCGEPIDDTWAPARSDAVLDVSCQQCHTQRYWLPAAGQLERDADLGKTFEPWPRGVRKHVTSSDNPARGRRARPEDLQLCLRCGKLRGPYRGHDNLCKCDHDAWDREPTPRYGDLSHNAHLCWSCVATVVRSGTRWSPYYCETCRPAVALLRRVSGRNLVPIGPHSLMNGVSWSSTNGNPMTQAQAVAFSDQLNALFVDQRTLGDRTRTRTLERAQQLGFTGHAVLADDYLAACRTADFSPEAGFVEFVVCLGDDGGRELAAEVWRLALESR